MSEEIPRTKQAVQEELARGLGIEWTMLESFVQGQKRTATKSLDTAPFVPQQLVRSHRGWSSRLPLAAVQTPAYIINVFPESTRPFVSSFLASSTSVVVYSLTMYLAGFFTGATLMPATHHHHYAAPYSVMVGVSDAALWQQCK